MIIGIVCPVSFAQPYSWARPAILAPGKGRGGMFLFLLFLHCHSCFSLLSLSSSLLSLPCLVSLSLGDDTQWPTRADVSLNPKTVNVSLAVGKAGGRYSASDVTAFFKSSHGLCFSLPTLTTYNFFFFFFFFSLSADCDDYGSTMVKEWWESLQ